jgi:prophage regulatory protein
MKIIRPQQTAEKCGIALSTLWAWAEGKPDFPKPVQLSGNVSGFIEEEVETYLERKVAESRAEPTKRETAGSRCQEVGAGQTATRNPCCWGCAMNARADALGDDLLKVEETGADHAPA